VSSSILNVDDKSKKIRQNKKNPAGGGRGGGGSPGVGSPGGRVGGFSTDNCTYQIHFGMCNLPQCSKNHLSDSEVDSIPMCFKDPACLKGFSCGYRHVGDSRGGKLNSPKKGGGAINLASGVSLQPGLQLGAVKMSLDGSTIESFEPVVEADDEE